MYGAWRICGAWNGGRDGVGGGAMTCGGSMWEGLNRFMIRGTADGVGTAGLDTNGAAGAFSSFGFPSHSSL